MKQVLRKGIKDIIVDDVPDPVLQGHHVLIRPVYSLISSGTETASIHQEGVLREVADNPSHIRKIWEIMKVAGPIPTTREVMAKFSEYAALGYSGAGIVAEKHPTVTDLEIGDGVAYGGEGTGHAETIITGRNLVARIPDGVAFEHACFSTLGSIALNAVRIAGVGLGDSVVVIGLGLVGQLIAQLVRLQGTVVIATDLKPERAELARQLGAHHAVAGGSTRDAVNQATNGRGADCVIIAAASKSAIPCQLAVESCRDRGRIVVVGAVDMSFAWNDMYMKEIQLYMSRAYGPGSYDPAYEKKGLDYPLPYVRWTENRNMEEFLRVVSTGEVRLQALITHEFPLDDAPRAYSTIMEPANNSLAVLLRYKPEAEQVEFVPRRRVETAASAAPASSKDTLQVALVGAGNLARWSHVPNLKTIKGVELRAVQSGGGVRAKSYAVRFRAAYATTDYEEILKDPNIDAVLITSRNQYHAPQAIDALRAGKHVFVEKPVGITEEECRAVCRAVKETGKHLTVGFNRRFAPFYTAIKRELRGRSGPVVINCRVNSPGISPPYWMADPAIGGAILGEACHFVDLMYWLLESEPVLVSAFSLPTGKQDPIGENNMTAAFSFADGSVASLAYSTIGSKTSSGERIEVFAPGLGIVSEDFKRLRINKAVRRDSKKMWADKGYREQMQSFFDCIRKNTPQQVSAWDGARASIVCLRMLESCRSMTSVEIDLESALDSPPQADAV